MLRASQNQDVACGWARTLTIHNSTGCFSRLDKSRRARAKRVKENLDMLRHTLVAWPWYWYLSPISAMKTYDAVPSTQTFLDHATDAASVETFERYSREPESEEKLISGETLPENISLIDFKDFAAEYPDKFFPLIYQLRPEFQEIFIEYYLLKKSQNFIGKVHGFIQTRTWQNLRIIEQTIGAFIILGTNPTAEVLEPILRNAGLEVTDFGGLSKMIALYASSQSYAAVAKAFNAPIPTIRKIFRPAITRLLADKDIKTVAVGAYLRNLTHHASLRGAGLSKQCLARTRRIREKHFTAPPSDRSPILSFGKTATLGETPWTMFEIRNDETKIATGYGQNKHRLHEGLRKFAQKNFGRTPVQIFIPMNSNGELAYDYIFARSGSLTLTRSLTRVLGVSQVAATYDDNTNSSKTIPIPHRDVLVLMQQQPIPLPPEMHLGDFVRVLTGEAEHYCGTITEIEDDEHIAVEISFPTGRRYLVKADSSCLDLLPNVPANQRAFWGVKTV